jgi:haloalkane dehalogenase
VTPGLLAALVAVAPASAATRHASGIFNARYCEVLELRGLPPDATVTVWNTLGLNDCPADQWRAIDAGELAHELGATAVILNGPRYFLMDAVTAVSGRVRSFHGLRMRQAATIQIRTQSDVAPTPYTERTIARRNDWTWNRGRTVYELVAPGGATYVMQSYAQIRDPCLTLGDLPGLGARLSLPGGWRYRSRKLRRDLVLRARGAATVVQDDLLDTYQRLS